MTQRISGAALIAGLVANAALAWPLEAVARGGGFGGHAGGYAGFGHIGYGRGGSAYGPSIRFGTRNGFHGRVGIAGGGRGYFPSGGFGAPGYYPSGPAYPYAASYGDGTVATQQTITTRSVVVRRGPAFGEPGYVSHPAIYRLVPAESRPGTRRFKVERLDF